MRSAWGRAEKYIPSTNEQAEGVGDRLQNRSYHHDGGTDEDCSSTAKTVRNVWGDGICAKRANILLFIGWKFSVEGFDWLVPLSYLDSVE